MEELWKTKTHLEDERRLQDRTVEQLQRKVIVGCRETQESDPEDGNSSNRYVWQKFARFISSLQKKVFFPDRNLALLGCFWSNALQGDLLRHWDFLEIIYFVCSSGCEGSLFLCVPR